MSEIFRPGERIPADFVYEVVLNVVFKWRTYEIYND